MVIKLIIIVYAAILVAGVVRSHLYARHLAVMHFEGLLNQLAHVRREGAASFSERLIKRQAGDDFSREMLWNIIGGSRGLKAMLSNSEILIALVQNVETGEVYENQALVDEFRRDARSLRFTVPAALVLSQLKIENVWSALLLRRAGKVYWSMVDRLLDFYGTHHAPRCPALCAACNTSL